MQPYKTKTKQGKKKNLTTVKKLLPRATSKKQMSQRDSYGKAMSRAQKKGGSNGVGVGY